MDVTWLYGILTGGGVLALAGLVGAAWEAHREHKRWLRNQRAEAYLELQKRLVDLTNQLVLRNAGGKKEQATLGLTLQAVAHQAEAIVLLGPLSVNARVGDVLESMNEVRRLTNRPKGTPTQEVLEAFSSSIGMFNVAARRVLRTDYNN